MPVNPKTVITVITIAKTAFDIVNRARGED